MNFTIVRRVALSVSRRPVDRWPLEPLLREIGAVPRLKAHSSGRRIFRYSRRSKGNQPKSQEPRGYWYDVLDEVRRLYRQQIAVLHPDRGGCTQRCARLNAVYATIKRRLEPLLD